MITRLGLPLTLALAAAFAVGLGVRLTLLPTADISGVDLFVSWVHGIAKNGLPSAYDAKLTFTPVMAYIWWLLAAVEPGFQTATDSSDQTVRVLMKLPATLADFGARATYDDEIEVDAPRTQVGVRAKVPKSHQPQSRRSLPQAPPMLVSAMPR